MGTLHGPVICRTVVHSRNGARLLVNTSLVTKGTILGSGLWGSRGKCRVVIRVGRPCERRSMSVNCSFSSSSDGNGSMAENFSESDEDYVDSSVIEAVEVRRGSDGFLVKMRDGKSLRCIHNNPQGGHLPDYAPHPAIVLKMEDGSELLLPIIVLEMPSILLMAAVCNVQIARPTVYQVVKEMIDKMGYQVKLVRVTKRVHEAYFAQLYLTKVGNEKDCISFDLRPSDAINMAVRCRVPIQVNKHLAYSDGMKVLEPSKMAVHSPFSDGLPSADLDRPDGQPCLETKEFDLVRNMLIAAVEERYRDAEKKPSMLVSVSIGRYRIGTCQTVSVSAVSDREMEKQACEAAGQKKELCMTRSLYALHSIHFYSYEDLWCLFLFCTLFRSGFNQ